MKNISLTPKQYYYEHFRDDLNEWINKTRAHSHHENHIYVPIQDLRRKNLSHIDKNLVPHFIYSLTFTTLIDQVMYTHFKDDYPQFKKLTEYPKLEYAISNLTVAPWRIAKETYDKKLFGEYCEFFIKDYEKFFDKNKFQHATFRDVVIKMREDKDVGQGELGIIFLKELKK